MKSTLFLGWEGTGSTIPEAKEDAKRKIQEAAEGFYSPLVITYRGYTGIVWRDRNEYGYTIISPDRPDGEQRYCSHCGNETRQEANRRCRAHLAQMAWRPGEGDSDIIIDDKDRRDFQYWAKWQNQYRRLKTVHPEWTDHQIREECFHS